MERRAPRQPVTNCGAKSLREFEIEVPKPSGGRDHPRQCEESVVKWDHSRPGTLLSMCILSRRSCNWEEQIISYLTTHAHPQMRKNVRYLHLARKHYNSPFSSASETPDTGHCTGSGPTVGVREEQDEVSRRSVTPRATRHQRLTLFPRLSLYRLRLTS